MIPIHRQKRSFLLEVCHPKVRYTVPETVRNKGDANMGHASHREFVKGCWPSVGAIHPWRLHR